MTGKSNAETYGVLAAVAAAAYIFRSQLSALFTTVTAPAATAAPYDPYAYSCLQADGSNDCIGNDPGSGTPAGNPIAASYTAAVTAQTGGATPAQQAQAAQVAATVATGNNVSIQAPINKPVAQVPVPSTASGFSIQGSTLIDPAGVPVASTPYVPPPPPAAGGQAIYTFGSQTGLTAADLYSAQIATIKSQAAATPAPPGYRFDPYLGLVKLDTPVVAATTAATTAASSGAPPPAQAAAAQAAATTSTVYAIQGSQLTANGAPVYVPPVYTPPPAPAAGGQAIYTFGSQTGLTAAQLYAAQVASLKANAAATPAPPGFSIGTYGGLVANP